MTIKIRQRNFSGVFFHHTGLVGTYKCVHWRGPCPLEKCCKMANKIHDLDSYKSPVVFMTDIALHIVPEYEELLDLCLMLL